MPQVGLLFVGVVAALLALGVTAWVFVPAFRGREVASRDIGSLRLAVGAWLAMLVLNGILTLPLAPVLRIDQGLTTGTFLLAAVSTQIPMLVVVYGRCVWPGAVTWSDLGLRRLPLDYLLRMGLGGGVFGLITTEIIGTVLSQVGLRQNQLDQFAFIRGQSPVAFTGLLVAAAITAPIVEELFFRGMLFGLLRRRHSLPVAYLVSGLLFTVLHLEPTRMNVTQMAGLAIGIFVLGTLLAWLYQHTGSLLPGIVAHAVNNATGLILFYAITPG